MSVAKKPGSKKKATKATKASAQPNKKPAKPDEMSGEVIEFIQAIDHYKRVQQRPFPSWSEVLEVLKTLGYSKAG